MAKSITIGTFNVENLFMRYKFFYSATKKKGETEEQAQKRQEKERKKVEGFMEKGGYIENLKKYLDDAKKEISHGQTSNTAKVILAHKPQIMVLQEVEDMDALRAFNSDPRYLAGYYQHKILIDGNDPRKIDVAVLSNLPITYMKTNMDVRDPVTKKELFGRDCLMVDIGLKEDGDTIDRSALSWCRRTGYRGFRPLRCFHYSAGLIVLIDRSERDNRELQ
jgi:hypothetical protein